MMFRTYATGDWLVDAFGFTDGAVCRIITRFLFVACVGNARRGDLYCFYQ